MRKEKVKRIAAVVLLLLLIVNLSTTAYAENPTYNIEKIPNRERTSSDLEYTFADLAAMKIYAYGGLSGDYLIPQDSTDEPITRYRAAEILYLLFYSEDNEENCQAPFIDINAECVNSLYAHGIINGTGCNLFEPERNITKEQFISMLLRVMGYTCENTALASELATSIGLSPKYVSGDAEYLTLGEAALYIISALDLNINGTEDILYSSLDTENIQTIAFPSTIRLDVKSVEDAYKQIENTFMFVPLSIHIYSDDETTHELLIKLIQQRWNAHVGGDDASVEEWIFDSVTEHASISYQINSAYQNSDKCVEDIAKITQSYNEGKISWSEYLNEKDLYYALNCFTDNKIVITPAFSIEWCLAAELDDVFTIMQDPTIAEVADQYYQKYISEAAATSDYDAVIAAVNAIMQKASYDYTFTIPGCSLKGFFENGKIVCSGYASIFQYLMLRAGIDSLIITGDTTSAKTSIAFANHAWNKVKLDGKWYNVDVCWSDTGGGVYQNLLKSDSSFKLNGKWIVGYYGGGAYKASQNYR